MSIHEKIARASLDCFNSLPKTGKPNGSEWTVLSTIVKSQNGVYDVIALGTGSKCISSSKMSPNGDVLNDSHAEIVCRRAFLVYLYNEMLKNDSTLLVLKDDRFALKAGVEFHFFTTHTPCGDASIFPKGGDEVGRALNQVRVGSNHYTQSDNKLILYENEDKSNNDDNNSRNKNLENHEDRINSCNNCNSVNVVNDSGKSEIKLNDLEIETEDRVPAKRLCREGDIFRTGAKCLSEDVNEDPREGGANYHVIGAVRTKPGRGDRTLSVSCSDKLAKWCYLGIQGCLLGMLLEEPVYLQSFTIAGETPFNEEALNRALFQRFPTVDLRLPYRRHTLQVGRVGLVFPFGKDDNKRPCPSSIIYTKSKEKKVEVAVEGRKQGVAKKDLCKKSSLLTVCRSSLLGKFLQVVRKYDLMKDTELDRTYGGLKALNGVYNDNWDLIKRESFKIWTVKDAKLLEFYQC